MSDIIQKALKDDLKIENIICSLIEEDLINNE